MSISKRVRFEVLKRDGFTCVYCGGRSPDVILEVDHRIARSSGGTDSMSNLVTACLSCNRGKSNVSLYNPGENFLIYAEWQDWLRNSECEELDEGLPKWMLPPRNRYHISLDPHLLYLEHVYGRKAFTYDEFNFDEAPF